MQMQLPKQFLPCTLDEMLEYFGGRAEKLGPMLWEYLGMTEEAAKARIGELERKGLVQYAISPTEEPSIFIASSTGPYNPYTDMDDYQFADKLVQFWDVTGKFDQERGEVVTVDELVDNKGILYHIHTPEGPLGVVAVVALRLLSRGLIRQDELGAYHAPSKELLMQWTSEHGICDFCSNPEPKHVEPVPDFSMEGDAVQDSIGGWATCQTCHEMIHRNERSRLLRRAIEASGGGKFTAATIKRLHERFWQSWDTMIDAAGVSQALVDFIEDKTLEFVPSPKMKDREVRFDAIKKIVGLDDDEIEMLLKGDVVYKNTAKKLSAWRKKFGAKGYEDATRIAKMMSQPSLPPGHEPHWQIALDKKVDAINQLKVLDKIDWSSPMYRQIKHMDLPDDLVALRAAEVYSFNGETMHAIITGAQSIPHESNLYSVEIPKVTAGWFWFAEPFPVVSSPIANDTTCALLWSWDHKLNVPTIRFSAYVFDVKGDNPKLRNRVLPSTKWVWPAEYTFHQMIGFNQQLYEEAYGKLGPFTDHKEVMGKDGTLKVVAEMSLFFLMACLWFRQTVPGTKPKLTSDEMHIERHARKRYEKEFKAKPVVRVIALRRSAVTAEEEHVVTPEGETKRHVKVRFVVAGHARLQPCGPGRKDRKLIWIDPFTKGPDGAPFKPASKKVYAVIR